MRSVMMFQRYGWTSPVMAFTNSTSCRCDLVSVRVTNVVRLLKTPSVTQRCTDHVMLPLRDGDMVARQVYQHKQNAWIFRVVIRGCACGHGRGKCGDGCLNDRCGDGCVVAFCENAALVVRGGVIGGGWRRVVVGIGGCRSEMCTVSAHAGGLGIGLARQLYSSYRGERKLGMFPIVIF